MKSLRLIVTFIVALGGGLLGNSFATAQEQPTQVSVTLEPVQFASVKGNADKFRELNWMKDGYQGGISDISFIKEINKDTSLEFQGRTIPDVNDHNAHMILRKGDMGFLAVDYKSFRKYYNDRGGVKSSFTGSLSGTKASNAPDLQLDLSYFKLETGLGVITDPFIDIAFEHNTKEGAKTALFWTPVAGSSTKIIGPSWRQVNDTVDRITAKEKKEVAGITLKGEQRAEFDYSHSYDYLQALNTTMNVASSSNKLRTQEHFPDAKLFASGVRAEKWMLNDKTFAGLGYHYNHTHSTDLFQNQEYASDGSGLHNYSNARQSLWSFANNIQDEHVWVGDLHADLTSNLAFISSARYQYLGRNGTSDYQDISSGNPVPTTPVNTETRSVKNDENLVGEHVALRYAGISHTSLYVEGDLQQDRDRVAKDLINSNGSAGFDSDRIGRTQKASWTLGGRVVPNKYFTITNQVRQYWQDTKYDSVVEQNAEYFLDALKINGEETSSTVSWRPWHWISNSLRYQFINTRYFPRDTTVGTGLAPVPFSKNHLLSSVFTYDISLQPTDSLLLLASYSHVESYVKTLAGSASAVQIPGFNSGDNSWLFSSSYSPKEGLTWTNTVNYTLADNFVDFSTGVPEGADFRQLSFSTGLDWTLHKWITIEPGYEYASYRDNPLAGVGTYSAHIFKLNLKFNW